MLITLIGFIFAFDILLSNADDLCIPRKAGLDQHNLYRSYHKVPALTEDPKISEIAQKYADKLMEKHNGKLIHSSGYKYGENLYGASSNDLSKNLTKAMIAATNGWYSEICLYSNDKPGFSSQTGHYTQLVWAKTKKIGLGVAVKGKKVVVVTNYYPPGNIMGSFNKANVPPTNCKPFEKYCETKKIKHPLPAECGELKSTSDSCGGGDGNSRGSKSGGGKKAGNIQLNFGLIIPFGIMIKGIL